MRLRSQGLSPEFHLDLELEATLRHQRRQREVTMEQENIAAHQPHPPPPQPQPRRRRFGGLFEATFDEGPIIYEVDEEHYQIPPAMINLIQQGAIFQGLPNEDPNDHLTSFLTIATTCNPPGATPDHIRRKLFPFSLRGQALSWYKAHGGPMCRTFDEVKRMFLAKYFPPSKVEAMRRELQRFHQFDGESFNDCWERFQDLMRRCPTSILDHDRDLQNFFDGLTVESQGMLNAYAGGLLMEKDIDEVEELCQRLSNQAKYYAHERRLAPKKPSGVLEVDDGTSLQAQMAILTRRMSAVEAGQSSKAVMSCGICQGEHHTDLCPMIMENVNYVNNYGRQGFQQQNQRLWGQPAQQPVYRGNNWGQGQNSSTQFQSMPPPGFQNSNSKFSDEKRSSDTEFLLKKLEEMSFEQRNRFEEFSHKQDRVLDEHSKRLNVQETSLKNLEMQMGQMAQELQRRPLGNLPSDTIANPKMKENCNAIYTRSGKPIGKEVADDETEKATNRQVREPVLTKEDIEESSSRQEPVKNKKDESSAM